MSNVTPTREDRISPQQLQNKLNDVACFLSSHRAALATCMNALHSTYETGDERADAVAETLESCLIEKLDAELEAFNDLISELGLKISDDQSARDVS